MPVVRALALLSWRRRAHAPAAGWLALALVAIGQVLVFYAASFAGGLSVSARMTAIDLMSIGDIEVLGTWRAGQRTFG